MFLTSILGYCSSLQIWRAFVSPHPRTEHLERRPCAAIRTEAKGGAAVVRADRGVIIDLPALRSVNMSAKTVDLSRELVYLLNFNKREIHHGEKCCSRTVIRRIRKHCRRLCRRKSCRPRSTSKTTTWFHRFPLVAISLSSIGCKVWRL